MDCMYSIGSPISFKYQTVIIFAYAIPCIAIPSNFTSKRQFLIRYFFVNSGEHLFFSHFLYVKRLNRGYPSRAFIFITSSLFMTRSGGALFCVFGKSSKRESTVMWSALHNFLICNTHGFFVAPLSILLRVLQSTHDIFASSTCVSQSLFRTVQKCLYIIVINVYGNRSIVSLSASSPPFGDILGISFMQLELLCHISTNSQLFYTFTS